MCNEQPKSRLDTFLEWLVAIFAVVFPFVYLYVVFNLREIMTVVPS